MIVYRIENKEGIGPFTYYKHPMNDLWDGIDLDRHPTPSDDGIHEFEMYIFGCTSLSQLEEWFTHAWKLLEEQEFHISRYKATKYKLGKTQVAFIKEGEPVHIPLNQVFSNLNAA